MRHSSCNAGELCRYTVFLITGSERQLVEMEGNLMKVSNAAFHMKLTQPLSLKILRTSKYSSAIKQIQYLRRNGNYLKTNMGSIREKKPGTSYGIQLLRN
jgi:hypothetical protein